MEFSLAESKTTAKEKKTASQRLSASDSDELVVFEWELEAQTQLHFYLFYLID